MTADDMIGIAHIKELQIYTLLDIRRLMKQQLWLLWLV